MNITKKDLEQKLRLWKDDKKYIDLIDEQVGKLAKAEIIVELFVGDFTARKALLNTDSYYMRYTPYAKVLKVSENCTDWYKENLEKGTIVLLNDSISFQIVNPHFEQWFDQQGRSPNTTNAGAPPKFVKGVTPWVTNFLFHPDKLELSANQKLFTMDPNALSEYRGPFILKIPQSKIETLAKI